MVVAVFGTEIWFVCMRERERETGDRNVGPNGAAIYGWVPFI